MLSRSRGRRTGSAEVDLCVERLRRRGRQAIFGHDDEPHARVQERAAVHGRARQDLTEVEPSGATPAPVNCRPMSIAAVPPRSVNVYAAGVAGVHDASGSPLGAGNGARPIGEPHHVVGALAGRRQQHTTAGSGPDRRPHGGHHASACRNSPSPRTASATLPICWNPNDVRSRSPNAEASSSPGRTRADRRQWCTPARSRPTRQAPGAASQASPSAPP